MSYSTTAVRWSIGLVLAACWPGAARPPQAVAAQASEPADTASEAKAVSAAAPDVAAVRAVSEALVAAYNAGRADEIASCFLPGGEVLDDAGNLYEGREQIAAAFKAFRERFPTAKMTLGIDSIRLAADDVALENGTRTVTTDEATAVNKYTMTYVKRDGKWLIASAREDSADAEPTPRDRLEPLQWMVGEWVEEGPDAVVSMVCRWAPTPNFLLVDFTARVDGAVVMQSHQRIGWDPLVGRIRSWTFDADGGYGEAYWVPLDEGWMLKSTATLPDGESGAATIYIEPVADNKIRMKGLDRMAGDSKLPDFEALIVRKPPLPGK